VAFPPVGLRGDKGLDDEFDDSSFFLDEPELEQVREKRLRKGLLSAWIAKE